VVQIKTAGYYGKTAGYLSTTKILQYFEGTNFDVKILHIVTPPNYRITNYPNVVQQMNNAGIQVKWTFLK